MVSRHSLSRVTEIMPRQGNWGRIPSPLMSDSCGANADGTPIALLTAKCGKRQTAGAAGQSRRGESKMRSRCVQRVIA